MDTPPLPPNNPPPSPLPPPAHSSGPTEQQWKLFLHLGGLIGLFVSPGNIIAPLVIWLLKKQELSPAFDAEAKKVLNFQISYTIYAIISVVIAFTASCLIVPILLPVFVGIAMLVLSIIGAVKASNNEPYEYPFTIRML